MGVELAAGVMGLALELLVPLLVPVPLVGIAVAAAEEVKPEAVGAEAVEFWRRLCPAHECDNDDDAEKLELKLEYTDEEADELTEVLSALLLAEALADGVGVGVGVGVDVGVGDALLDGAAEELEEPEPPEPEEPPLPPVTTKFALTPCGTVTTQKLAPPAPSLCWPTSSLT